MYVQMIVCIVGSKPKQMMKDEEQREREGGRSSSSRNRAKDTEIARSRDPDE
jgi:hypothetical protein